MDHLGSIRVSYTYTDTYIHMCGTFKSRGSCWEMRFGAHQACSGATPSSFHGSHSRLCSEDHGVPGTELGLAAYKSGTSTLVLLSGQYLGSLCS